jgi:hypothetical protein
MDIEGKRRVLLCQPKTILVSQPFLANDSSYKGTVQLTTRLDEVVAYRVKYFNITIDPGDWDPQLTGSLVTLCSSSLGSNVNGGNHFVVGNSSVGTPTEISVGVSDVIGWGAINLNASLFSSAAQQQLCNTLQPLSRPLCIERFDWSLRLVSATVPPLINHFFTIEFAIEFYSECTCQKRLINQYGSL